MLFDCMPTVRYQRIMLKNASLKRLDGENAFKLQFKVVSSYMLTWRTYSLPVRVKLTPLRMKVTSGRESILLQLNMYCRKRKMK